MSAQLQEQVVDKELEGLLSAAKEKEKAPERQQAIAKVSYNHMAMVDLIVARPGISQNEIARHFGMTPSWISQIIVSDVFQAMLAKRRAELIDPVLMESVELQFKSLVVRSLDILHEKLNRPANEIPDNLALRALEVGSRAAGYGVKSDAPAATNTPAEVHIHLEQLGGGLVALLQRKKLEAEAIDGKATQIAAITDDVAEDH